MSSSGSVVAADAGVPIPTTIAATQPIIEIFFIIRSFVRGGMPPANGTLTQIRRRGGVAQPRARRRTERRSESTRPQSASSISIRFTRRGASRHHRVRSSDARSDRRIPTDVPRRNQQYDYPRKGNQDGRHNQNETPPPVVRTK